MQRWFVLKDKQKLGPFTTSELQFKLIMGDVSLESRVCREGGVVQREIADVPELFEKSNVAFSEPLAELVSADAPTRITGVETSVQSLQFQNDKSGTAVAGSDALRGATAIASVLELSATKVLLSPVEAISEKTKVALLGAEAPTPLASLATKADTPKEISGVVSSPLSSGIEIDFLGEVLGDVSPSALQTEKRNEGGESLTGVSPVEPEHSVWSLVSEESLRANSQIAPSVAPTNDLKIELNFEPKVENLRPAEVHCELNEEPEQPTKLTGKDVLDDLFSVNVASSGDNPKSCASPAVKVIEKKADENREAGFKIFDTNWFRSEVSKDRKNPSVGEDKLLKKASERNPTSNSEDGSVSVRIDKERSDGGLRRESNTLREDSSRQEAQNDGSKPLPKRRLKGRVVQGEAKKRSPNSFYLVIGVSLLATVLALVTVMLFRRGSHSTPEETTTPATSEMSWSAPPVSSVADGTEQGISKFNETQPKVEVETKTATIVKPQAKLKLPKNQDLSSPNVGVKEKIRTKKSAENAKKSAKNEKDTRSKKEKKEAGSKINGFKMGQLLFLQNVSVDKIPQACAPCRVKARLSDGRNLLLVSPNAHLWSSVVLSGGITVGLKGTVIKTLPQETWILLQYVKH